MTMITPHWDGGKAEENLNEAAEQLQAIIDDLRAIRRQTSEGRVPGDTETQKTVSATNRAVQSYIDARNKLDDQRRKDAGLVHDYAIDFEAARDEVRGLLARLRGAGGAGAVSE